MSDDNRRPTVPSLRKSVLTVDIQGLLHSRSDLGYRMFDNLSLRDLEVCQSIFPGSIFRSCEIAGCNFSRSDFEGTRFEKCTFSRCFFNNCDIRSTIFANCEINDCSFEGVYLCDNVFKNSSITSSNFDHAVMIGNQFNTTSLQKLTNRRATILHTEWISSNLISMMLGDCTCLYNYFENCQFLSFHMNADAIGLSFGISETQLKDIDLIFLGETQNSPNTSDVASLIINEFNIRGWHIHQIIATINFERVDLLHGWSALFAFFHNAIIDGSIRLDDVRFALGLAQRLVKLGKIPLYSIILAHDALGDIELDEDDVSTAPRALGKLKSGLFSIFHTMQQEFFACSAEIFGLPMETPVILELVFLDKPKLSAEQYISTLLKCVSTDPIVIRRLGSNFGSWHDIIQTTLISALALYSILFLVEGSLVKLLLIRARLSKLIAPRIPKKFVDMADNPQQPFSRDLMKVIFSIFKAISNDTIPLQPRESGWTSKNLKEIRVKTLIDE